ncbi:MAG: NAD(P)-dependent oxidoreductase, partial [Mesorhizobium sp.]
MNILVTGAGGFLGQRLVSVLRAQGHDVWGVTRRSGVAQS